MALPGDFVQPKQKIALLEKDFRGLYERTKMATAEALKDGDAYLKAAISSSILVPSGPIRISPLFLTFDNAGLERAYLQILSSTSNKKDVIPFAVAFIIRVALMCFLLQPEGDHTDPVVKDEYLCRHFHHLSIKLVSYLWIVAICFSIFVIHFRHLSWYSVYRTSILFMAYSSVFLGEGLTIHTSLLESSPELPFILAESIFMSVLYRVSFCWHLKTRTFGFALQIITIIAGGFKVDALRTILYISLGHVAGIVLAYVMDQKSRIEFLLGFPRMVLNGVFRDSTKVYHVGVPRRALGGFAGGFAGVSSLKCGYSPSLWTVTPSDLSTAGGSPGGHVTTTFTLRKEKKEYWNYL